MRWLGLLFLCVGTGHAEARGWVCSEQYSIQKYKLEGNELIADNDSGFERRYGVFSKWTIVTNNDVGLIAVMPSAKKFPTPGLPSGIEVYIDVLMIEKQGGGYKHFSKTRAGLTDTEFSGSCTTY